MPDLNPAAKYIPLGNELMQVHLSSDKNVNSYT